MEAYNYRTTLKIELHRRIGLNENYSLRAFAQSLGLNVGTLSSVLSQKRSLSIKSAKKILEKLTLDPKAMEIFLESVLQEQKSRQLKRVNQQVKDLEQARAENKNDLYLDNEMFQAIADWVSLAILELTFVHDFQSSPQWIAKRLGISQTKAKLSIDRLLCLNLLTKKNGQYEKTNALLSTRDKGQSNSALKRLQISYLEKAIQAIEYEPIESRCTESLTIAIDPKKVPLARKMIADFVLELGRSLQDESNSSVYQICLNLFNLESPNNGGNKK